MQRSDKVGAPPSSTFSHLYTSMDLTEDWENWTASRGPTGMKRRRRAMPPNRCCDDNFSALSSRVRCFLVVVVVLVVVVAVFVPLYFLVFRHHFPHFWSSITGGTSGPDDGSNTGNGWQPDCPDLPVLDRDRYDCYPDDSKVTRQRCEERGCCWARLAIDDIIDKDPDLKVEPFRDKIPACIYPRNYGYRISGKEEPFYGGFELPLQRIPAPSRYGDDVHHIRVRVEMQTPHRLRIKIYDPSDERYEVPDPVIPMDRVPDAESAEQVRMYATTYNLGENAPFSIKVRRADTGIDIFDTGVGGLTFSHQFLQISTKLPCHRIYGLGEHLHKTFPHDTKWRTWSFFNRDAYPEDFSNLYGSHPMYMCVEKDFNAHAVLLLNSNAMEVQLQPTPAITFRTTGGILDFYFFLGPTPEDVVKQYTAAVGRPMMPPYWALGFHLGRWGYGSAEYVEEVQKKMRDMDMPQDVAHLDMDYRSHYRMFTLDEDKFAKLPDVVRDIKGRGQHVMLVLDPAISSAKDKGVYPAYTTGASLGVFVNDTWGNQHLQGAGWPGPVVFPDFGNPSTQPWWTEELKQFHELLPFDGIWITSNEPSNYVNGSISGCVYDDLNRPPYKPKTKGNSLFEGTLCMDAVQWLNGIQRRHYDIHNLYGHMMSAATYQSLAELFGHRRFLLMSRSTFVGSGRYVGHWLGDNASRWPDMAHSIPTILEFSIFGIPLVGADICGYFDDAAEELCLRWTQLGIFYPLARNNNAIHNRAQDPSAFSESFQNMVRRALKIRYELLPYLYTLFYDAHTKGTTVARPLFHVFPDDIDTHDIDKQFMWGDALLISPVLEQGSILVDGYFPKGTWYDYHTGQVFAEGPLGQWLPIHSSMDNPERPCNLHVRGGSIIVTQRPANTTAVSRRNPMKLIVALSHTQEAVGDLYWDDGETKDAHILGECIFVNFRAFNNTLNITSFPQKQAFQSSFDMVSITEVNVFGVPRRPQRVILDDDYPLNLRQFRWHHTRRVAIFKNILLPLSKNSTIKWFMR
ncbi:sucrase-isomaltase, intestinal-like isoform X2 [Ornithodoros turicata]|uniref:sucrase-isomaltase, intestinal-like isoform X2 n=1 Tax=Ornithodoros turicata TaxID=34597 RepID=UPI0031397C50